VKAWSRRTVQFTTCARPAIISHKARGVPGTKMSLALIIIDVSTTERHGYGAKFIFLFLDRLIKKKKKKNLDGIMSNRRRFSR
jgi:hypothetical protein